MNIVDRILTILVTATLTSAVWIVAGGSLIEMAGSRSAPDDDTDRSVAQPAVASDDEGDAPGRSDTAATPVHRDASADAVVGPLQIPVLNVRPSDLTDTFMDARGGGSRLHEAIDIMAPTGTSVMAAAPGEVEKLFASDAGGNTVYVRSNDGLTIFYYAHLDAYAEGLREGQRVRRGQRLGTVGSSGNASSDAPHLHFAVLRTTEDAEWWEPATALNPYPMLAGTR